MKRLCSLPIAKVIALLLLTVSVIGIPYLIYLELYSVNECQNITQISDLWNYTYEESQEFANDVDLRMEQLIDYLKLKEILETNGELDYDKVVAKVYGANGIEEYTVNDLIKYNAGNYGFYPEDAMRDYFFNDVKAARELLVCMKRVVYPILITKNGEVTVGEEINRVAFVADFTKEENQVFSDLDEACRYYQALLDQQEAETEDSEIQMDENRTEIAEFLDSISDKLQKENGTEDKKLLTWINSSEEVNVNLLSDAAYCMTHYVALYQEYQNIFEKKEFTEKDFLYWISAGDQETITNMEDKIPVRGFLGDDRSQNTASYDTMGEIRYQTGSYLMEGDMQVDRRKIAELETLFLEQGRNNVSIYLAVPNENTGLFCTQKKYLEQTYRNIPKYVGGIIGLGILAILCICFLCSAAGHREGYEGIYLNWFDRWYTEIAAGICIGLGLFFSILVLEAFYRLYIEDFVILALCYIGLYVSALISFPSLIRRIKARSLWKNSICYQVLRYIKKKTENIYEAVTEMWKNRSVGKKAVILYVCTIIGNFIVPVALIFLCEAIDYGELGVILICLFILAVVLTADFKILRRLMRREAELEEICIGAERISSREWNYKLEETAFHGTLQKMAATVNQIGNGLSSAIEQSIRDERMKTDLITNVSHDIKTPLTSIINYVDLLKREQFEDEKVRSYLEILDQKSQRLKNLIDDLIEASKLSSKTVILAIEKIDFVELVRQANGEFAEKFAAKNLTIMPTLPEKPIFIEADGKRMWRILENLYTNVSKYAMEHTRVYISILEKMENVEFSIKNISENPLNIEASELTERFIRGDLSRSTEGSGLGLSIAKSLTELMHGEFEIYLDGDLFRVTIVFKIKEGLLNQEGIELKIVEDKCFLEEVKEEKKEDLINLENQEDQENEERQKEEGMVKEKQDD